MKTQQLTKNILPKFITLFICLAGLKTTAQNTIPDFTVLNECEVSNSTGYHDGSGWVDIDNDGDLDLIITNSAGNNKPNLLYRNERTDLFHRITNTEFTQQNAKMALAGPFGDLDNDGDEDLVLADWQGTKYTIYQNDGYGNFHSIGCLTKSIGAMAALIDMDGDSYLDLVDINVSGGKIYTNDGTGNYSGYEHISISPPHPSSGLACICFGDADDDNDLDLYMGINWSTDFNPDERNMFCLNNGTDIFEKEPDTSAFVSEMKPTLGANWVDYDNDGDMDLYVLETSFYGAATDYTGTLYENKGGLVFEGHVIEPPEYCNTHKVSPVWGDLDNDGDQDLYITVEKTNFYGHVSALKHNILFQNNGDGSFTEVTENILVDSSSHTATLEDYDNDGDLDALLVAYSWSSRGRNYLYENQGNVNSWIVFTCEGTQSGRTPYGTRIYAKTTIAGKSVTQTREITPTTGHNTVYPSSRMHFGLGDAERVDTLIITWPSGHVDAFLGVEANQFYRIIEDSVLEIDYKATNYIRQNPHFTDTAIYEGENLTFNLEDYYELVKGDMVPKDVEETLSFSLFDNDNTDAVNASLEGNVLTITPSTAAGISTVQVLVSAGFTERVDGFRVEYKVPSATSAASAPRFSIYPNPVRDMLNIECSVPEVTTTTIEIIDISGKVVYTSILESDGSSTRTINLESLEAGIYLIRIGNSDFSYIEKIIKR